MCIVDESTKYKLLLHTKKYEVKTEHQKSDERARERENIARE